MRFLIVLPLLIATGYCSIDSIECYATANPTEGETCESSDFCFEASSEVSADGKCEMIRGCSDSFAWPSDHFRDHLFKSLGTQNSSTIWRMCTTSFCNNRPADCNPKDLMKEKPKDSGYDNGHKADCNPKDLMKEKPKDSGYDNGHLIAAVYAVLIFVIFIFVILVVVVIVVVLLFIEFKKGYRVTDSKGPVPVMNIQENPVYAS